MNPDPASLLQRIQDLEAIVLARDKEINEKNQVIDEKNQVIAEMNQVIAEMNQVIAEKVQMMAEKDRALSKAQKVAAASSFIAKTPVSVFADYKNGSIKLTQDTWSEQFAYVRHPSAVDDAWKKLCSDNSGLLKDVFEKENEELHPAMKLIYKTVIRTVRHTVDREVFDVDVRPTVYDPSRVPDLTINRVGLAKVCWSDIMIVSEIKLPPSKPTLDDAGKVLKKARPMSRHEGAGETITYLSEVIKAIEEIPEQDKRHRYGVFSDFESVAIFFYENGDFTKRQWSGFLELFPPGWHSFKTPTAGFRVLCDIMAAPLASFATVPRVNLLSRGTLRITRDVFVGIVEKEGKYFAAKAAQEGAVRSAGSIFQEYQNMLDLAELDGFDKYYLPLHPSSNFQCLITPLGETLTAYLWNKRNYQDSEFRLDENNDVDPLNGIAMKMFHDVFKGLRELHRHGKVHADIRPHNLVVFEDRCVMIDWASCHSYGTTVFCRQGYDPYSPDEAVTTEEGRLHYLPKWDFLCLAYSMVGIACGMVGVWPTDEDWLGKRRSMMEGYGEKLNPVYKISSTIHNTVISSADPFLSDEELAFIHSEFNSLYTAA